jgi:Chlamydia polymorphic membrane protein (Chlamydia_PMP) repeat
MQARRFAISIVTVGLYLGAAQGATLTVTSLADAGPATLREAITLANASVGVPDTIVFNVEGTITLASRLPDIADDLTIDGSGATVTLSGGKSVQVLFVSAGKRVRISDLTIADGHCASPCSGGAILNVGLLEVTRSTFIGNSALLGGAIHNFGTLEVAGSTFIGNAARFGGAIHNFDKLTVTDCLFTGNSAMRAGGAIHNFDRLNVVSSHFSGNSASEAGGGIDNVGSLSVAGSVFASNSAAGAGDHISNASNSSTMAVVNSHLPDSGVAWR